MIVVTGATGNLGGAIASRLSSAGHTVRLFVRDPRRAPSLSGAEVAVGDFADPRSVAAALEPGDRIFMVSVHADNPERVEAHQRLIGAVAAAGAKQIVYLSFMGARPDAINYHARSHGVTEQMIRASGVPWTFLRPSLYMEVLHKRFDAARVLRAPAGAGRAAWVARDDIAAVAATVLAQDGHEGKIHEITGPRSLSMSETARVVSEALGRRFRYEAETSEEGWEWRRATGQTDWEIRARIASWESVRAGEVSRATGTVHLLTGVRPRTLTEYVTSHGNEFP